MAEEEERAAIELGHEDAAFVWRKDGSVEGFLPNLGDAHVVELGCPEYWCAAIMLAWPEEFFQNMLIGNMQKKVFDEAPD